MLRRTLSSVLVGCLLAVTAMAAEGPKIGDAIDDFTLPDARTGDPTALSTFAVEGKEPAKGVLLLFIATQCPVSNDYNERMAALHTAYEKKGIRVLGINSNKQESVPEVVEHAKKNKLAFTIVKDPDNKIADVLNARVTPEAYLLEVKGGDSPKLVLRYHGAIDDSQNTSKIQSKYLDTALDAFLAAKPIAKTETKAFGCTIKRVDKPSKDRPSATP